MPTPTPFAPANAPPWRPWSFLGMLFVLAAFHLLFMIFLVPFLAQVAASSGAPLPLLLRVYFAGARFVTASMVDMGPLLLLAALGWLLGIHLMLRRHPLVQRLYCYVVYLGLFFLLASVYALSLSLGLAVIDFQ